MKLLTTFFLIVPVLAWSAGGAEWSERTRVLNPSGNLTLAVRWDGATGVRLRLTPTNSPNAVVLELNRKTPLVRFEPKDGYPQVLLDGAQFNPEALPTQNMASVQAVIKFRQETWSVYIGNRPIAVLPAPFLPPAIVAQSSETLPPKADMETRFQKTDDFVFHDDFMVPEGEENELAAWEMQSGEWGLHSVADDFTPVQRRVKGKPNAKAVAKAKRVPTAALSPNFYSLRGKGTNAVLTTGYEFYDAYAFEAAMQVGAGEGGILFDHTDAGGYFAFTAQPEEDSDTIRLSLWRTTSSNAATRVELAAVTTEAGPGQWIMLKIRTFQNRIECYVDKTKVIDIPAELPAGGRFGLFADSDAGLLFDDVTARSNHDLDFLGTPDLRRHTLVENGRFFPRRSFFGLFSPKETPFLSPPESTEPQWLVVGTPSHGPHLFAADFGPAGEACNVGLLAGYAGADRPYFRFICQRDATNETFRLERVRTNDVVVLTRLSLALHPEKSPSAQTVTLMCDATDGRELRCYRNKELVLVQHGQTGVGGASGVYVGPGTRVRITNPEYSFERTDLYTDQFEKNTAYLTDHFMRHWSSPEGQWEEVTNSSAWYKGDVFGRLAVHLPLIDQTSVHLGVVDGTTNGTWVMSVSDGSLELRNGRDLTTTNAPADIVPTNLVMGFVGPATNQTPGYVIHAEGYWLWVTSGDALLLEHALPEPLQGRRLRITGFTSADLASSRVERYNVKDFLFKESLHEWTLNGGRWEVINRFNCDPRWSHMNGESTNGLAALWSKYLFHGDFCVEMYAGTRHGWYARCGDYNLTVMNRDTTASQGYSVTCSGWDYDLSQLYTKLYRNGSLLTQSDAYCAPRTREGNKRKVRPLLVEAGRDVHGAWYYIKFRRVGKRLEYYFDNDLVFACDDPDPLQSGSLGVWTFMNSMVVARVKIAAESVEPRPVIFASAAPARVEPVALPAPAAHERSSIVAVSPDAMRPEVWEVEDPVSRARLGWHTPTNGSPYFAVTSVQGGGTMLTRCALPPVSYPSVSGWRFEAKRTTRGLFNLYYSLGRRNAEGTYVPERFYFHRISGEAFAKGKYRLDGQTDVTGVGLTNADWHTAGAWTTVNAWLPVDGLKGSVNDTSLLVRVEGFGDLEASYAIQGLIGNGPGEGYAVRGFLAIPHTSEASPTPALSCAWSRRQPDTVELRSGLDRLDRAFAHATVMLGTVEVQPRFVAPDLLVAMVPRTNACGSSTPLTVSIVRGANTNLFKLKWQDATVRTPPMLVSVDGISPLIQSFEQRSVVNGEFGSRSRLDDFDPAQGSFLTLFNMGLGQRLSADFGPAVSLARYPVVQFRYRGGEMARISLGCGAAGVVHLSEAGGAGRSVRGSGDLRLNDQWQTWLGTISDAVGEQSYQAGAMNVDRFRLGSVDGTDQTGAYTELNLDDLVVGPSVARKEQLTFTPHYFDFEGVTQVQMAVLSGPGAFSSLDVTQRERLVWADIPNERETMPEIKDLGEGLAHLLLKARNTHSVTSPVTDIPFLIDRIPPTVSAVIEPISNTMANGTCEHVTVGTGGGAPLDIEALKLSWNDTVVPVANTLCSTFTHAPEQDTLILNWPLIFREQLNRSEDGQTFRIVLSGIRDGAGNAVTNVECQRRIDYAGDHTPPTLLSTSYPSNMFCTTAWEVNSEIRPFFTAQNATTTTLVRKTGEAPYLAFTVPAGTGGVVRAFSPKWNVRTHPYLAFRLRQPGPGTNDLSRVKIVLEFEPTNSLAFALTNAQIGVNRPLPATGLSNEWQSFAFDVSALLKGRVTAEIIKAPIVKSMALISVETNSVAFNLNSVYIFAPWGRGNRIDLDAYDESGIGGIDWESTHQATAMGLEPAAVPATADGAGWITLRARDKAGNLSTPLYVPIHGSGGAAHTVGD